MIYLLLVAGPVPAETLWSLRPVSDTQVPAVRDAAWPRGPVDRFVLARLEAKGLRPNADAGPHALLRRLHFDLVGLPPSPDELAAFAAAWRDGREAALARVVDRLLASPHFGERWGRHWLDVARYGESNGGSRNVTFPLAWKYRDYVIASFNADKPFDRFVTEQVAGDLLPAADAAVRREQVIATGFLAVGSKPLFFTDKACFTPRAAVAPDWADDQIDAVSRAFLGLSVACARCHDHKFDPVPQRDYYALAGIFASTKLHCGPRDAVNVRDANAPHALDPYAVPLAEEGELRQARAVEAKLRRLLAERAALKGKKAKPARDRLTRRMRRLAATVPRFEYVMGALDAGQVGDAPLRERGRWDRPGETVPRGFLSAVPVADPPSVPPDSSGRRELADWLTRGDNPLTPRVIVNRVWLHMFGRGLVTTPDTFGVMGSPPTHPELLDRLAADFVRGGWSVKRLVRRLALSRAYRMSSTHNSGNFAADPENALLWRQNRRRLEAEALRDALLLAGGLLDRRPPRGSALAGLGYRLLTPRHVAAARAGAQKRKRSVYVAAVRGLVADDFLKVFDAPEPSNILGRREATTVAPQALVLMNSPEVLDCVDGLAARLAGLPAAARARRASLWLCGRPPVDAGAAARFVSSDGVAAYCQALLFTADFRYLD